MKKNNLPSLHPVLDKLYTKSFAELQDAFAKFEEEKLTFDVDTFHDVLTNVLKVDVLYNDVRTLFYQIDCYAKENITYWDLISFLQHFEEQRTASTIDVRPFKDTPAVYPCLKHSEIISQILLYPDVPGVQDEAAGYYILASQNGALMYWNQDMDLKFTHPIQTDEDAEKISIWVTGLTCFPREQILALSTTTCDVRFFRSNPYRFERLFSIVTLPQCVTAMDAFTPDNDGDPYWLVMGNTVGAVNALKITADFFEAIKKRAVFRRKLDKISYPFVEKDVIPGLQVMAARLNHYDQVLKVMHVRSLNAVVSCAAYTERAMLVHFFERNSSLAFSSSKGILCFDFCQSLYCIITGGMDYVVKMWNPAINDEPKDALEGHSGPVTNCLVDENRMLVVTVDQPKNIRVWDLLRRICRQVLSLKEIRLGPSRITSSLFDVNRGKLLLNTFKIVVFEPPHETVRETHTKSVVLAAHNALFGYVVTVGQESQVSLWELTSGRLVSEFDRAHRTMKDRFESVVEVTAAGLDPTQRRLVTAARDGCVKVWNFHIGQCLAEFHTKERLPLLAVGFIDYHIYVAGWNRRVSMFYDNGAESFEEAWEVKHRDDIVGIDTYRRSLVASASFDGEIIVWFRENGFVKFRITDTDVQVDDKSVPETLIEFSRLASYSIDKILFLHARSPHRSVANLVTCGADGLVRFWCVCSTSRLLAKFRAVFGPKDAVLCMATDRDNRYLVTGDTLGYLRVYEISSYFSDEDVPSMTPEPTLEQLEQFPFLRIQKVIEERHAAHSKFPAHRFQSDAPLLLNCFRAHVHSIVQVAYVDGRDLVLTGGYGGSVRLWTVQGTYAGRFGSRKLWDLGCPDQAGFGKPAHMPTDVRRAASPLTLKVFNSGKSPYWYRATKLLSYYRLGDKGFNMDDSIGGKYFFRTSRLAPIPQVTQEPEIIDLEEPRAFELTSDLAHGLARLGFIPKATAIEQPEHP